MQPLRKTVRLERTSLALTTNEKVAFFTKMPNMEEEALLREKRRRSIGPLKVQQQLEIPSSFLLELKPATAS